MKSSNEDGKGHEFDYFDEYPQDDPFMPKPTCSFCNGTGTVNFEGQDRTCSWCYGTGVQDGR